MANYAIAIKSLARGEREKAKKHFERTVATKRVGWSMYHWARAFLQRMEEDPAWPAWIPPHKTE
jgi:hypothetical protein